MKKQVAWTQSEIDILIEKGSELFLHELADLIPRHSPIAIGAKKNRLGVTSSNYHQCIFNIRENFRLVIPPSIKGESRAQEDFIVGASFVNQCAFC